MFAGIVTYIQEIINYVVMRVWMGEHVRNKGTVMNQNTRRIESITYSP